MTKEDLEKLYMDVYDNGIPDYDYREKFKRYVNNRFESLEKENAQLKEANQTLATMNESMWVELEMKRAESQGIVNRLHQLVKAKEILTKILNRLPSFQAKSFDDLYLMNALSQAEQFLRDTDIDNAIQHANQGLDFDRIADEMKQDLKENEAKE